MKSLGVVSAAILSLLGIEEAFREQGDLELILENEYEVYQRI